MRRILALAFALGSAGFGSCAPVRSAQADCVPTPAQECRPALEGTLLDGTHVAGPSFQGKVVLVNFWATWCAPCLAEMPAFERVFAKHRGDGFVILGVLASDGSTDDEVRAFLSERGVSYPVLRSNGGIEAGFTLGEVLPMSFLYDRSGKLVQTWKGLVDEDVLATQVSALVK